MPRPAADFKAASSSFQSMRKIRISMLFSALFIAARRDAMPSSGCTKSFHDQFFALPRSFVIGTNEKRMRRRFIAESSEAGSRTTAYPLLRLETPMDVHAAAEEILDSFIQHSEIFQIPDEPNYPYFEIAHR
jgi:hypothetical protein